MYPHFHQSGIPCFFVDRNSIFIKMKILIISVFIIILQCCFKESSTTDCQTDWKLVFVAVGGNGETVWKRWRDKLRGGCCEIKDGCLPEKVNLAFIGKPKHHLKSKMVDKWRSLSIDKVKVELYKYGERKADFIFNGKKSDYKNWFTKGRLLASSFEDLYSSGKFNYFSIDGNDRKRTFFINKSYGGCPNDIGWFVVVDKSFGCPWEKHPIPAILYGRNDQRTKWQVTGYGIADYMAIYIKTSK